MSPKLVAGRKSVDIYRAKELCPLCVYCAWIKHVGHVCQVIPTPGTFFSYTASSQAQETSAPLPVLHGGCLAAEGGLRFLGVAVGGMYLQPQAGNLVMLHESP